MPKPSGQKALVFDTCQLSSSLLKLLVADNLLLQLLLHIVHVTITLGMNLSKSNHHQVIVVATLIERRNIASLSVENPLHSLTGSTKTGYTML